ncbi:YhaI family protein [Halobacillus litoralis]|uniref:DUF1878 family protein n=1 Tax=Halobacillus litoralis TaxID=45668 RepID=UPI001CD48DD9|nr:DUF1878 family protein [Halobacillus litoralis]MCA0969673.1 YhaI family protein [Halobacillus litoralis]
MKTDQVVKLTQFQLKLLTGIEEFNQYPFTKMIVDRNVTESEYIETMQLLHTLDKKYKKDINEGFLDYESLLIHFAGMLCYKLPIEETIDALYREQVYPSLIEKLREIIQQK